MGIVRFDAVDVVFGEKVREALELLDAGHQRDDILERTGAVVGVAGADLDVEEGEVCVLMGLSGSGKSSLLRCVNGLNTVSRGALHVEHEGRSIDVASCDPATLRMLRMHRIAMVFQQFGLLPWRSVRDNVGFGLELRGVPAAELRARVEEKLELVHLEAWADKAVSELSGGMQQRVGLARAFATDGDILLMDEPFSALDPLIRTHLQDELLDLQTRLRKTIIFVSHDLDEALKLGNRIVIMEGGRIVQNGTPEDIVFNPVNDYVRAFVANMNPLNVLRAGALMRELPGADGNGAIDCGDGLSVRLDEGGALRHARIGEEAVRIVRWPVDPEADTVVDTALFVLPVDATMRELVVARQQSGAAVLVAEGDRPVGIVGDREIFEGLLRQTSG